MAIGLVNNYQTAENRKAYKQIQILGTVSKILPNVVEYNVDNNVDTPNLVRTISFPINCSQANQTVYPYIHTNKTNVVYDYTIVGVKI